MGKSNRRKKEELIKIYGPKCFIEELGLRKPSEIAKERKKYTGKKQLKIMDELTYHHIIERSKGGKTTIENGAVLRNINHQWFNRLSKERQAEINKMFQEYKKKIPDITIIAAQLTTEGIQETRVMEFEDAGAYIEKERTKGQIRETEREEKRIENQNKRTSRESSGMGISI